MVSGGEDDDAAIESPSSRKFTVQQFVELAQSMQQAVVVKDRRHHLRVYPKVRPTSSATSGERLNLGSTLNNPKPQTLNPTL